MVVWTDKYLCTARVLGRWACFIRSKCTGWYFLRKKYTSEDRSALRNILQLPSPYCKHLKLMQPFLMIDQVILRNSQDFGYQRVNVSKFRQTENWIKKGRKFKNNVPPISQSWRRRVSRRMKTELLRSKLVTPFNFATSPAGRSSCCQVCTNNFIDSEFSSDFTALYERIISSGEHYSERSEHSVFHKSENAIDKGSQAIKENRLWWERHQRRPISLHASVYFGGVKIIQ